MATIIASKYRKAILYTSPLGQSCNGQEGLLHPNLNANLTDRRSYRLSRRIRSKDENPRNHLGSQRLDCGENGEPETHP